MIGENQQLVPDEPVEDYQDCRKLLTILEEFIEYSPIC